MSEQGAGVNRRGRSHFTIAREDVEKALFKNKEAVRGLLGPCEIKVYPDAAPSVYGRRCPWCNNENTKDDCSLYLLSEDWKRLHCESCGGEDTLVKIFMNENGLSLEKDADECADRIAAAAGVHPNYDEHVFRNKFTHDEDGQWIIDTDEHDDENYNIVKDVNINLMTSDIKNWIIEGQKKFMAHAESKTLIPRDNAALQYVMKRGIRKDVIVSSGLFIETDGGKTFVYMPSYNCDNELAGYQYFSYDDVHNGGKAKYKSCVNSRGSSRFPFGLENCDGDEPILMVCGFFDYLSARQAGITRVISPFGIVSMGRDLSHLKAKLSGKTIYILFDRKPHEINEAVNIAEHLRNIGCKVNVLIWLNKDIGYDFNDFLLECNRNGVEDINKFFKEMVPNNSIRMMRHGIKEDVATVIRECEIKIGNSKINGVWPGADRVHPKTIDVDKINVDEHHKVYGSVKFEVDLEVAISGLMPLNRFHSLIIFSDISDRFEMCDTLSVKKCNLKQNCSCSAELDISDGRYASAFLNSIKMSLAVDSINSTYFITACPTTKGWDGAEQKKVLYSVGENSRTWLNVEARSVISPGCKVRMVVRDNVIDPGIYEVKGFKSAHCGMTGSVYVISEMNKFPIDPVVNSMPIENTPLPKECSFFDRVSSAFDKKVANTPDMIFTAATLAWAFSPPVIPLLRDRGKELVNYRQPSLSIYAIGDPATGKTNTIREISLTTGNQCNPTDAKMATKPGLIISGSDGSPGQMVRSIGRIMGLDEITDKPQVVEIAQLLIENRISMSMSGRHIDEIVPVRIAILSNANAERMKIHDFKTPMQAATLLLKEHGIRRIDLCVATKQLSVTADIDHRKDNIYTENSTEDVSEESLLSLGRRAWRQRPSKIVLDDMALKLLLSENLVLKEFSKKFIVHERLGNPMMYGDISQKIFRISCGIAGFCGSFVGDEMVIRISHINDAILLLNECMTTMDASVEARFNLRTMNVDKAYECLVEVAIESMEWVSSRDDIVKSLGRALMSFFQQCRTHDAGAVVNTGIIEAYRMAKNDSKDPKNNKETLAPYNKAWKIIYRMKDKGLLKSERRGLYSVTETFFRAVERLGIHNPGFFDEVFGIVIEK